MGMFYPEPNAKKPPTKKTKTNGFDSLKPRDILPFLMKKPNSLVGDKPIIPPTQRLRICMVLGKFF